MNGRSKANLNENFIKSFMILNIINFANMSRREKDEVSWVGEETFITIKLIWHSYLVLSLGNYDNKTLNETSLTSSKTWCL